MTEGNFVDFVKVNIFSGNTPPFDFLGKKQKKEMKEREKEQNKEKKKERKKERTKERNK